MNEAGAQILDCLKAVDDERAKRAAEAGLEARVMEVKRFQQARFEASYRDLLANARYAAAARFFLEDLYGPGDFAGRDRQFARIVPALVRLFPSEIVGTVLALSQLHALSEQLDTAMGRALPTGAPLDATSYGAAWRAVGRNDDRQRQIALVLEIGRALDRYTRKPLLRQTLRLMRGPAEAAGLAALQGFLERGFDSFRAMRGAEEFLRAVAQREGELASRLFDGHDTAAG